jgi:hypothetical protein
LWLGGTGRGGFAFSPKAGLVHSIHPDFIDFRR